MSPAYSCRNAVLCCNPFILNVWPVQEGMVRKNEGW